MLRIAVISMLLGALALFAGLTLFFAPASTPADAPPIVWDAAPETVHPPVARQIGNERELAIPDVRAVFVSLGDKTFSASAYPYLHIAVESPADELGLAIVWRSSHDEQATRSYRLETKLDGSIWLATGELRGWEGEIDKLTLIVSGEPGDPVVIEDFALQGPSPLRQLLAIYSDLTAYAQWNRAAMNSHTGVIQVSSFYPVPLVVAFLLLSLLAYGFTLLLLRNRLRFDWKVVALIFLSSWLVLDLIWQKRLLHQLADTHRTFAGKSTQEKLAVGPDAELYRFVSGVKQHLAPDAERIFVASSDEYSGLRGAYYLYPYNVFWALRGQELPHSRFLHSGDYILAIKPTATEYGRRNQILAVRGGGATPAEVVFADAAGTLYRVP